VVDAPRAELDRKRNPASLRELVRVDPKREPVLATRLEIAARLRRRERAPFEEDVGRFGKLRRLRQDVGERSNSGGTACAPSQVGTPPPARIARSCASSVSRSRP
jgi:hypothetical protein